jgi:two-component system CheB/CheR fusion protein
VLASLIPYDREIQVGKDIWMLASIQPYRTLENMIDGVVLTFTDISISIKAVAEQAALKLADGIVSTIREPLLVLDGALRVIFSSQAFYREFQVSPEESLGQPIYELGNQQWDIPALRELLEKVLSSGLPFEDFLVEHDFPRLGYRKMLLNARPFVGEAGPLQLILLSIQVNT